MIQTYILMAILSGPGNMPMLRADQGSTFTPVNVKQGISPLHPQFKNAASLLMSGERLAFDTEEACATFKDTELKTHDGVALICIKLTDNTQ